MKKIFIAVLLQLPLWAIAGPGSELSPAPGDNPTTKSVRMDDPEPCPVMEAPVAYVTPVCYGGDAQFIATPAYGGTIAWYGSEDSPNVFVTGAVFHHNNSTGGPTLWAAEVIDGCPESPRTAATLILYPKPTISVTEGMVQSVCEGEEVTLTATGADSYTWVNTYNTSMVFNNGETFTATGSYNFTVTGTTNAHGCTASLYNVLVSSTAYPVLDAGPDVTACVGTSFIFGAGGAGNTGTIQYSDNNFATIYETGDQIDITSAGAPLIFTARTIVPGTECITTGDEIVITINELPTVEISPVADTICAGASITLSATGNATTYSWNNSVVNNDPFTPASGTHVFIVTGELDGCTLTDTVGVVVLPGFNADAGDDLFICEGAAAGLIPVMPDAEPSYTIEGEPINIGQPYTYDETTTAVLTLTRTIGTHTCTATDEVVIHVSEAPVISEIAATADTICAGGQVTFTATANYTGTWNNEVIDGDAYTVNATTDFIFTANNNGCLVSDTVTVTVPAINAGADFGVCEGAEITLTAIGSGVITWDNEVINGVPFIIDQTTTFTVTAVTAFNGTETCTTTDEITVTINDAPAVNAGDDITVCAGSEVTLTGSADADFAWDNDVEDGEPFEITETTTFTLTANNGGCITMDEVTVTVPAINAGENRTVCAGSEVILSATGAVTPDWNNEVIDGEGFIAEESMMYIVTDTLAATTGTCVVADTMEVTVNELPAVSLDVHDITVCAGSELTLTATGTNPVWEGDIENGIAFVVNGNNTYTVTVSNEFCSNSDSVEVTVNELPSVTVAVSGTTLTATAAAGVTYQWISCANNQPISGATSATYTATANGSYAVIVTNANDCSKTSSCATVSTVGIEENAAIAGLSLYPNPTEGKVFVTMTPGKVAAVTVHNAQGQIVVEMDSIQNGDIVDLTGMQQGIYMVKVVTANGSAVSRIAKN